MKIQPLTPSLIAILISLAAPCFAGPPAPPVSSDTVSLLTSAGFHARKPENPEQRLLYGTAPAYRILRAGTPWQNFYAYKDEGAGIAYVGDEIDYQRYCALAAQSGYAYGAFAGVWMEADPASRWSEAFGVRHVWTCR
ncbi:MAG: hypothetical protein ACJ8HQ_04705 [Chthoniobacterales bacterium]